MGEMESSGGRRQFPQEGEESLDPIVQPETRRPSLFLSILLPLPIELAGSTNLLFCI